MPYADGTQVPVAKSKGEIEKLITKQGGDQFVTGWSMAENIAKVGCVINGRQLQFVMPLPDTEARTTSWEREHRRLWRCLLLIIKSKFTIVETGIQTFDEAFMADIVTPSGQRMGDVFQPQIALMYETGEMPKLLEGPK